MNLRLPDTIRLGNKIIAKNPQTGILEPLEVKASYGLKTKAVNFMIRLQGDWEYYIVDWYRRIRHGRHGN